MEVAGTLNVQKGVEMRGFAKHATRFGLSFFLLLGWVWAQEVVPVYEGQRAYLDALQAEPGLLSREKLARFDQLVLSPYAEPCAEGYETGFVASYFYDRVVDAPAFTDALEQLIAASADVEEAVGRAMATVTPLLPADPITFCLLVPRPDDALETEIIKKMGGAAGSVGSPYVVHLQVYPQEGWLERLEYVVAHEYHHAALAQRFPDGLETFDLLAYLVTEGKADSFAHLAYPEVIAPWTSALTPDQEREQWRALQPLLTATPATDPSLFRNAMFGSSAFPTWTGYTVGFHIVQAFLQRHPEASVEAWTALDAQTILKQSGYSP